MMMAAVAAVVLKLLALMMMAAVAAVVLKLLALMMMAAVAAVLVVKTSLGNQQVIWFGLETQSPLPIWKRRRRLDLFYGEHSLTLEALKLKFLVLKLMLKTAAAVVVVVAVAGMKEKALILLVQPLETPKEHHCYYYYYYYLLPVDSCASTGQPSPSPQPSPLAERSTHPPHCCCRNHHREILVWVLVCVAVRALPRWQALLGCSICCHHQRRYRCRRLHHHQHRLHQHRPKVSGMAAAGQTRRGRKSQPVLVGAIKGQDESASFFPLWVSSRVLQSA
jgi:hypothetical protein